MPRRFYVLGMWLSLHMGCAHHAQVQTAATAPCPPPAPFQQFVAPNFDWTTVKRVVLMPMANQTAYAHVSVEIQANLAAELQRAGRFDVVVATTEDQGGRARDIFLRGAFDEIELLRIAREYDAQAVLYGNVTQYHPYAPPRVGLSLIMISPGEGVAIASADGLWDARELSTAKQAQSYLQQNLSWRQGLLGLDRPLESPDVYQRFVCEQIASSLMPPDAGMPMPGQGMPGMGMPPQMQQQMAPPQLQPIPTQIMPAGYEAPPANPAKQTPLWKKIRYMR
jgi:hypothetical protein